MDKIIAVFFLFFLAQSCFAQEQNKSVSPTSVSVDGGSAVQAVPVTAQVADQQEPDAKENLPASKAEPVVAPSVSAQAQEISSPPGVLPPGFISSPVDPEHEVEFFIETNKKVYRQGENIYLRFWIKNNGSMDIRTLFKDALVQFFTDKKGHAIQNARDFVIDKSEYPRYVILCIPTDKKKFIGSSMRQTIVRPGFYLLGPSNVMLTYGSYWNSNVVPIQVWNQFDMDRAGAPDEGVSGEDFIKQKRKDSPFVVEPF